MTSWEQVQLHDCKQDAERIPISWSGWWAEEGKTHSCGQARAPSQGDCAPLVYPVALGDQVTLSQAQDLNSLWTCLWVEGHSFAPHPALPPAECINGSGLPLHGSELFILETSGSQNHPSVAQVGNT